MMAPPAERSCKPAAELPQNQQLNKFRVAQTSGIAAPDGLRGARRRLGIGSASQTCSGNIPAGARHRSRRLETAQGITPGSELVIPALTGPIAQPRPWLAPSDALPSSCSP